MTDTLTSDAEATATETAEDSQGSAMAFTFGDPEPVLDSLIHDQFFTEAINGEYYDPPVSFDGLAKAQNLNGYHESILHFKKNMILRWLKPSDALSYKTVQKLALDWVVLGNMYGQNITNRFGKTLYIKRLPSVSMRKSIKPRKYIKIQSGGELLRFKKDEVIHIKEPAIKQDIYGLPEYLGGLQAALLSENSTLFRRRFYVNGAHMGYILVTSNAGIKTEDAKAIEKAVKEGKGVGNGKSLYLNIPKTIAKDPVKVIPIGEIGTNDDYEKIQNATMREMIAMHRMQPGLAGLIPEVNGGFGDLNKIMVAYYELEIVPLQMAFLEFNQYLPKNQHISFEKPPWLKDEEEK